MDGYPWYCYPLSPQEKKIYIYIKEERKVGECIIYFFIINFPKTQYLKTVNIDYLTVSVGQDSWHSLTGSSGSGPLERLPSRYWWGLQLSQGSIGEGSASKLIFVVVGRISFLLCCCTEGISSSVSVGWRPPSVPCYVNFSIRQLETWQLASLRVSKREVRERV